MEEKNIIIVSNHTNLFPKKGIKQYTKSEYVLDIDNYESFDLNNDESKKELELRLKEIMFLFVQDKEDADKSLYKPDGFEQKQKLEEHIKLCDTNITIIQDFLEKHNLK